MRLIDKNKSFTAFLNRGGRVSLPPMISMFKIGHRVFFSMRDNQILVTRKPAGLFKGRIMSSRISRGNFKFKFRSRVHS